MVERRYREGIENGIFKGWYLSGKPRFEGNTRDGKIIRYIEWDEKGNALKIKHPDME
jgi:antitoxin component YwqK of YwqJK toxin-antitoxin module